MARLGAAVAALRQQPSSPERDARLERLRAELAEEQGQSLTGSGDPRDP